MTKLSHIPMQIQKWIASLAHLFFLILGLIGISLMYINGNFGLGLTGIGSVPVVSVSIERISALARFLMRTPRNLTHNLITI